MSVSGLLSAGAGEALLLVGTGVALAVLAGIVVRAAARPRDADFLTDGAVLVVSDGLVQQLSPEATQLVGDGTGRPVAELLYDFLGADAAPAVDAVGRLEQTGEPIDMLVRDAGGIAYQLLGAPAGALIRIVLREARYMGERLRDAETRVRAAETALMTHSWEQEALHALVAEGPIIAWHRTADGVINWCSGRIRTQTGSVTPEQAVELIVARMRLNRQAVLAGEPQKSRIEIAVGESAETVSLHVVEMVRQDGSRIGFATDAGSAAAAERTLTRFVQTMTETFAHLTVGLAIFDRNQTLALFNPALVQMWHVEPAWLARRPSLRDILDELRAIRRLPELEDFHQWRARLLGLFENTEAADYEELWHLSDGSNIRVLARPHPHGALAFTFDDVTERMRLEQRYRHSIDLRRATLDGLSEGVAVFGANGLLQFVNQAFHEIWGTDGDTVYAAMHARQLIGLCEAIAGEPEIWQKLHGFITGEENRRVWTARLETGTGRALTARFAPLPDGSTLTVFSDVSAFERVSEALLEREAVLDLAEAARLAVGSLGATAAGAAELIEAEARGIGAAPTVDAAHEAARGIVATAGSLRTALSAIGDIAGRPLERNDSGLDADPAATLGYAAAIARERALEAGVELAHDPAGAPRRIACPAARLGRIALQLALDAIGRSRPGGTVVLGAEGSAHAFCVVARCDAMQPPGAAGENPAGDRLVRLVAREGGLVEVEQAPAGGPGRITCRFAEPATEAPAGTPSLGGTVHPLTPRAG